MRRQAVYLIASFIVSVFGPLVAIPFLARVVSADHFSAAVFVIMLNTFFGVFDAFRPAIVKYLLDGDDGSRAIRFDACRLVVKSWSIYISSIILVIGLYLFSGSIGYLGVVFSCIALWVFLNSSLRWGVLESIGLAGIGQLMRAIASLSFLMALVIMGVAEIDFHYYSLCLLFGSVVFFTLLEISVRKHWGQNVVTSPKGSSCTYRNSFAPLARETFKVNFAKLFCDFFDRFFATAVLSPVVSSGYLLVYELSSKISVIPQYFNIVAYPIACAINGNESLDQNARDLYFVKLVLSALGMSVLFMAPFMIIDDWWGDVLRVYAGEKYYEYGWVLRLFGFVFGVYVLAFFSQTILRALGCFQLLSYSYYFSAISGALVGLILFPIYGMEALLSAGFVFKMTGVLGIAGVLIVSGRQKILILCFLCVVVIILIGCISIFRTREIGFITSIVLVTNLALFFKVAFNYTRKMV